MRRGEPFSRPGEQDGAGAVAAVLFLQQQHLKEKRDASHYVLLCDYTQKENWGCDSLFHSLGLCYRSGSRKGIISDISVFSTSYELAYLFAVRQAGVVLSQVPQSSYTLCIAIRYVN